MDLMCATDGLSGRVEVVSGVGWGGNGAPIRVFRMGFMWVGNTDWFVGRAMRGFEGSSMRDGEIGALWVELEIRRDRGAAVVAVSCSVLCAPP
jgi:hypothetical protein